MGIFASKFVDARTRHGADCRTGAAQAPRHRTPAKQGFAASLIVYLLMCCVAAAETVRVATWHVELTRKGPGLLLADIAKGDAQVDSVVSTIAHVTPDVILLTGIDWDHDGIALTALSQSLANAGIEFPYFFSARPNSGLPTKLDLDGDGYLGDAGDNQGWGRFPGHGGKAVLSKRKILSVKDFSDQLWADQPNALLPETEDGLFPSQQVYEIQRLANVGHWHLTLDGGLQLLTMAAGPPVFDGPEDRNGRRNHDEITFWVRYLDEVDAPAIVLGNANLDPNDGEGLQSAIQSLLTHERLQDTRPASAGGPAAAAVQGGVNHSHIGDPALDTVDWSDDTGPGNLRVSYVLPDAGLKVTDSGVFWPLPDDPLYELLRDGPRHRLVWVDLEL